jgi:hypothetical protein
MSGYVSAVFEQAIVHADSHGSLVLPGHPHKRYLARENGNGRRLLQPATVTTAAKYELQTTRELQGLVARAAASRTVVVTDHFGSQSIWPHITMIPAGYCE